MVIRRGTIRVFANQQNALVNRSIFDLTDFELESTANGSILVYEDEVVKTKNSIPELTLSNTVLDGGTF
jgi:hypothetical protein